MKSTRQWLMPFLFIISGGFAQNSSFAIKKVEFKFQPVISGVQRVFLVGSFNDWQPDATPMTDDDRDGVFSATVLLSPGKYLYRFVVDGRYMTDPANPTIEKDNHQKANSVRMVNESDSDFTAIPGDGKMRLVDLPFAFNYSMVNPRNDHRIEFKAKSYRNDVESILLHTLCCGRSKSYELNNVDQDHLYSHYQIVISQSTADTVRFMFEFRDAGARAYLTPVGFVDTKPSSRDWFVYHDSIIPLFKTPEWAVNGIFYQIFPDRFYNGDRTNDPDFSEPWYEGTTQLPESGKTNGEYFHLIDDWSYIEGLKKSPYRTDGRPDYYSFYGGDIAGVMAKLDYLKSLGITIIYFNPLNIGKSNHKYDAIDYGKIDPHFADQALFLQFVEKAHSYGIRIIVDIAYNHVGYDHFAFQDTREKGEASPYWDWFEWHKWPLPPEGPPTPCDYYDCWWGYPLHPNLNYDLSRPNEQENGLWPVENAEPNGPVVDYVLNSTRYWLDTLKIDGLRLDVPNECPMWFWRKFRALVDEINPDAFLIGELWGDATDYLGPHCFHSTMNYKFLRDPVLKFIARGEGDANDFSNGLAPGRNLYPVQATQAMMNLVGSHDTQRFITIAGGDVRKLKLSAMFQMTYPGIPHIYYGDEIGMEGGNDPDNRRPFLWNWEEDGGRRDIFEYYQTLIGLRKQYSALRTGLFQKYLIEEKKFAFIRKDENHQFIILMNNSNAIQTFTLSKSEFNFKEIHDELNRITYTLNDDLTINIPPISGLILRFK